jgi:hypothetical protein
MMRLIPSFPKAKFTPRKLIQLTEYPLAGKVKIRFSVARKFTDEAARASCLTVAAFLISNSHRPVIKGIRRMTSSIMFSDYQDKNDK